MERICHVDVQEDLEPHRLLDLVLNSRDIGLCLQDIGIEPPIVSAKSNEGLGRLGRNYQW